MSRKQKWQNSLLLHSRTSKTEHSQRKKEPKRGTEQNTSQGTGSGNSQSPKLGITNCSDGDRFSSGKGVKGSTGKTQCAIASPHEIFQDDFRGRERGRDVYCSPSHSSAVSQPHHCSSTQDYRVVLDSGNSILKKGKLDASFLPVSNDSEKSQVMGQVGRDSGRPTQTTSTMPSSSSTTKLSQSHFNKELELHTAQECSAYGFSSSRNRRSKSLDQRRSKAKTTHQDLVSLKRGWMNILGEGGHWRKHWFVLNDKSLQFYRDSVAEEAADLDGEISLATCYDVTDFPVQKNFGFQIHTKEGVFTLCAMTSGIRQNWIQAMMKNVRPPYASDLIRCVLPNHPVGTGCTLQGEPCQTEGEKKSHIYDHHTDGQHKTKDWAEIHFKHLKRKDPAKTMCPPSLNVSTKSSFRDQIRDSTGKGAGFVPSHQASHAAYRAHTFIPATPKESDADSELCDGCDLEHRIEQKKPIQSFQNTVENETERSEDNSPQQIAPLSCTSFSSSVQTDLWEFEGELQTLCRELDLERSQALAQREEFQHYKDRVYSEMSERKKKQEVTESKLQDAEFQLRSLESKLQWAEHALQEKEKVIKELRSNLTETTELLQSMEDTREQKEQRLQKHLLLLQESQERERRSLGASLEISEQRSKELEDQLQQQKYQWDAELQTKHSRLERTCVELQSQLEESEGEVGRLKERLQSEETLYYNLEHSYECVREELECARSRGQAAKDCFREQLDKKERELQEVLVKMAALGTSLEETEHLLKEARETCCHVSGCSMHQGLPAISDKSKEHLVHFKVPAVWPKWKGSGGESAENPDQGPLEEDAERVIHVIQALETKLSDTEEKLREITLQLKNQQQQSRTEVCLLHQDKQEPSTMATMDHGKQQLCKGLEPSKNADANAQCHVLREDGQGPQGSPEKVALALSMVLSKMAAALEHPGIELRRHIVELHEQAYIVKRHQQKAHILMFEDNEIHSACMRAELAYITYKLHGWMENPPREDTLGECIWETADNKINFPWQQAMADISHPELTPYQDIQDTEGAEEGDELRDRVGRCVTREQRCRGSENLVAQLHAQSQALHNLSLQVHTDVTDTQSDRVVTPTILNEALFEAQMAYLACRLHNSMQQEVSVIRSQHEQARRECQTACRSMKVLFREQAQRYEARLQKENCFLEDALARLKKAQEKCNAAEASAQQKAEEVKKMEEKLQEKLQELQRIHEEEMTQLHKYYTQIMPTSDTTKMNCDGNRKTDSMHVQVIEHETEINSLKEELAKWKEMKGDTKVLRDSYLRELRSLKATFEQGFSSMDESHKNIIEDLQRQHQREVECLAAERERVLQEETNATIAAIEVMRKAHKEELEKIQRSQQNTFSTDSNAFHPHNDEELRSIHRELEILSEQYSQKCLENKHLSQTIQSERQSLMQARRDNKELQSQNQELNKHLEAEISLMRSCVSGEPISKMKGWEKDLYQLQAKLLVKDVEIQYLRQEISSLKDELEISNRHSEEIQCDQTERTDVNDLPISCNYGLVSLLTKNDVLRGDSTLQLSVKDSLSAQEKTKLFEAMES
ncbi:golgin subfamily B member 1 [Denticeps clupeoides]|uniref:golgin subfamily B member 1 n=1 Tax=Denticeps clupeoides TaxID=299321 RepID=UPI0010A4DFC9|nr:golgin subfamily B member 1-like [Denticeps clupeoides]